MPILLNYKSRLSSKVQSFPHLLISIFVFYLQMGSQPKLFSLDINRINSPTDEESSSLSSGFNSKSSKGGSSEGDKPHSFKDSQSSMLNTFYDPSISEEEENQVVRLEELKSLIPEDIPIFSLSDIRILSQLGSGSYGIVSKVRYKEGTYALKAVGWNKTTQREIEVMHSVKSKYVMNIRGIGVSESDPYSIYLLLDYMNLRSAQEMMEIYNNPVPENIIAKMAIQILKGLRDMHSKRILHRDIKPANVLLDDSGQIKLADFGVSGRINTSTLDYKKTDAFSTFQGTFLFMSPERLRCEKYSYGSDIWALAMTLSELSFGHYPLKDLSDTSIWSIIQRIDNPSFKLPLPKGSSAEYEDFIQKCSFYNPKERSSIDDLMKHPFIENNINEPPKFVNWLRNEYVKPLKLKKKQEHDDRKKKI